jgi:hypothetical protein
MAKRITIRKPDPGDVKVPSITIAPAQNLVTIGKRAILKRTIGKKKAAKNANESEKYFDEGLLMSYLGKPVKDAIVFGELDNLNGYRDKEGNVRDFQTVAISEITSVVNLQKNIVKTSIQGKNGTIKEYSNSGDFVINITGTVSGRFEGGKSPTTGKKKFLQTVAETASVLGTGSTGAKSNTGNARHVDIGNHFPATDLAKLVEVAESGTSIPVTSKFLNNIFGINKVVFDNMSISRQEGFQNRVAITINLLSDNDVTIDILEGDLENLSDILNV